MFGREAGASRSAVEDASTGSQARPSCRKVGPGVGKDPMEGGEAKAESNFRFSETLKSTMRGPRVGKPQGGTIGGRPEKAHERSDAEARSETGRYRPRRGETTKGGASGASAKPMSDDTHPADAEILEVGSAQAG